MTRKRPGLLTAVMPIALIAAAIATTALAAGPSYRLEVAGLACPFCAYGIEKQLGRIDGVARLETDIRDGAVIVTMRDGQTLERSQAEQAVDRTGFMLGGFERIESAPGEDAD